MNSERGAITFGPVIGLIVIVLAIIGLLAVCNDSDGDIDTLSRIELIDHEYEDDYGSDGNSGYDGEGGRSGDMDQGGDDNCRNFCDNVITVPPSDNERERR